MNTMRNLIERLEVATSPSEIEEKVSGDLNIKMWKSGATWNYQILDGSKVVASGNGRRFEDVASEAKDKFFELTDKK